MKQSATLPICKQKGSGSGPYQILIIISLVDYKLAGPLKLWNGPPNFSRRGPEDPIVCKPGHISVYIYI